jgi:hypothetical protein
MRRGKVPGSSRANFRAIGCNASHYLPAEMQGKIPPL